MNAIELVEMRVQGLVAMLKKGDMRRDYILAELESVLRALSSAKKRAPIKSSVPCCGLKEATALRADIDRRTIA